jgi:hypothetical protein
MALKYRAALVEAGLGADVVGGGLADAALAPGVDGEARVLVSSKSGVQLA